MAGSTEPREVAVPKYFKKTPNNPGTSSAKVVMIVGLVVALVGLLLMFVGGDTICVGIIGILGGGVLAFYGFKGYSEFDAKMKAYQKAYAEAEPKPSDQQIDAWLNGDLARLERDSLHKLDLEPEQIQNEGKHPIVVVGPAASAAAKVGDDLQIRFSKYDLVCVYLTDYHLAAYNCTLDLQDGTVTRESTQEYHYTDVVSVSTRTESSETFTLYVNGEAKAIPLYQEFALSVASGEQIRVVIAIPKLTDYIEKGQLAPTGAEEAITLIRGRLREKKGGTHV